MAIIKTKKITNVVKETGTLIHGADNVELVWWFLKKVKHRITKWPRSSTPSYIIKRSEKGIQTNTCIWMFRAELFTMAKR